MNTCKSRTRALILTKATLLFAMALVLMAFGSRASAADPPKAQLTTVVPGQLTVLIGTDFLPGWMQGTQPGVPSGGVEYELAEEIGRAHGLKTVYRTAGFAAMTSGAMTDYDIALWTIFKTPEREKVNAYSDCYYPGYTAVLARKDVTLKTINDARELVWGAAQGSLQSKMVDAIMPTKPARVFSDTPAMFALLQSGKLDAVMAGLTASSGRVKQPGWENFHVAAVVEAKSVSDPCYAVQLPRRSPNVALVNDAIARAKSSGAFAAWIEKYLTPLGAKPALYPTFIIP